ncbi:N-acetylneuraminate synthase family protein [Verrucomicrobia bacterium]|nr:N-acetylneuraminate synthase family protein [Verrucomicrobiota bacterium]
MEIIAEIGQNHNGDLSLAKEMIHAAKENGAEVAKFQFFDAKTLFPKENNPWYEHNLAAELSKEEMESLFELCQRIGIEFMSSAFDPERVRWLEEMGVKRHKMASRSISDQNLSESLQKTGKPLLVSLGYWEKEGVPEISSSGGVRFLHCISEYPTTPEKVRLESIDFSGKVEGFSDHTLGISASMAALSRGATVIEKHFTMDKEMDGPDHSCSITPAELQQLSEFRNDLRMIL